jgi:hypothetical protein
VNPLVYNAHAWHVHVHVHVHVHAHVHATCKRRIHFYQLSSRLRVQFFTDRLVLGPRMQEGALACKQVRVTLRSVKPEPCDGALLGAPDPESRVHSPPSAHGESDPACGEAAGVMPALAASSGMAGGACERSASAAATVPDAASEPLAAATSWLESLKEGGSMPEHSIALTLTRARALALALPSYSDTQPRT